MIHRACTKPILILHLLICIQLRINAQSTPKSQWFEKACYVMLIYWSLYSAAEGL